MSNINFTVI